MKQRSFIGGSLRTLGVGLTVAFLFVSLSASLLAQRIDRRWIPTNPRAQTPEGTPIAVEILETSPTETQVRLLVPGYWQSTQTYGGRQFTKIEFPAEVKISGKGYPKEPGTPGAWWEFPTGFGQPLRNPTPFYEAARIAVQKGHFPLKALGSKATTEAEMTRLGIEVAGARPAVPRVRWLEAASRRNTAQKSLVVETDLTGSQKLALELPIIPAGFDGSDQQEQFGFDAPELIDDSFYRAFKGSYVGSEPEIDAVSGVSSFTGAPVSLPLYEVVDPNNLILRTDFIVKVKHLEGVEDFDCPLNWDVWANLPGFMNGQAILESLTKKGLSIEGSRSAHYLIVTPSAYREALDEFAKWKQSKGLNVDFAYVGGLPTDDVAANRDAIDKYLEAYFSKNYCHGVYVLLVGDVATIPTGRSALVTGSPDFTDADSDHVYEVLGNDRFPSLYVGRLSVDNEEQLKTQLSKILSYERTPVAGSWPTQASLAANSQNDNGVYGIDPTHPSKYAKAVNEIAAYGGYATPPTFQKLHAGAADALTTRATNADLIAAINQGRGQVLYRGHGNGSSWVSGWDGSSATGSSWGSGQVNSLTNSAFPIVYGIACQTARLRNSDSLSEDFMNRSGGGSAAYFGASVDSWTGENHERAKGIFKAIYLSDFTRLGPALARAEELSYISYGAGSNWDSNTFAYLLLGDPELTIRKRSIVRVNPTLTLTNLNGRFEVSVAAGDGSVIPSAFVNATLGDGSVFNGFTDTSGKLLLPATAKSVANYLVLADGYGLQTGNVEGPEPAAPKFVAFQPGANERAVGDGSVRPGTQTETQLHVSLPGVTIEEVSLNGRLFSKLVFPDLKLSGEGFPTKVGEAGWFDFPRETGIPLKNANAFSDGLGIGVPKGVFPRSAVGQKPTTAREMIALGIDPAGAQPGIPYLTGFVAASRKNGPNDLSLGTTPVSVKITLDHPIAPAGFAGSDGPFDEGYTAPDLIDETFYANFNGAFEGRGPGLSEVNGMGMGFSGVELSVPLVRVLTPTEIEVITQVDIIIKHLAGLEDYDCPIPWDSWETLFPFLNGKQLRDSMTAKGLKIEASRSARYVILTPQDWQKSLLDFAKWKQSKGLNVDFVFVGNGPGDDVPANRIAIDAFLENYFEKHYCNGVYVLICGDVNVIPSGRSNRVTGDPDGANADSDHVYEVLGNERLPSLYVGRLSANSETELKTQVDKILRYEKTPPLGSWPRRATLCANSQNSSGSYGVNSDWPSKYAKAVRDIATFGSYTDPPNFEELHAGAKLSSTPRSVNADVTAALNAGRGQILYRGHGDEYSWVSGWDGSGGSSSSGASWTDSAHVSALTNTVQPIVYAINCLNSRLSVSDCIAEQWMSRANSGAVAHFGATVTSYTGENHYRARGIFRAIYQYGHTRLGPALGKAEAISMTLNGGASEDWDSNTFAYLLLGDPEMTIRRQAVVGTINANIASALGGVSIVAKDEQGQSIADVLAVLTEGNGTRHNLVLGENGEGTFPEVEINSLATIDLFADGFAALLQSFGEPPSPANLRLDPRGFVQGGFLLEIQGPAGEYQIYGSENLETWNLLGPSTANGPLLQFIDPNAPRQGTRYYRVK